VARRTPHITTGAAPTKIHYCDQYNALMYVAVEFGDGTFRHHYLDGARPRARRGWRSRACGEHLRRADRAERLSLRGDGRRWRRIGGGEPVWPTTLGATVVDGALTWTCRTFAVTDVNCPHTKQVTKQAQKIYAKGRHGRTTVRYCKTGDPRDWTTVRRRLHRGRPLRQGLGPGDGDRRRSRSQASRSSSATTRRCGRSIRTRRTTRCSTTSRASARCTTAPRARCRATSSSSAQNGYRSVSLITLTDNLQDNDVGSAIDALVKAQILSTDDPLSIYYPKLGQFWCINGSIVWVYTFSRTSKISAWSKFTFPFTIDDADVLNQELYVRTGNDVYRVSDAVYKDGVSSIPLVDVQMFFQDGKRPGVLKQFTGIDIIGTGMWTVSHLFAADNQTLESQAYELPAITEPGALYPVELMSTRIAPHFTHQKDEAASSMRRCCTSRSSG
jgi:hypothetical protein